jgi:hypothetical protein
MKLVFQVLLSSFQAVNRISIKNNRLKSIVFQNIRYLSDWGSNKKHRAIKLSFIRENIMADPKTEEILAPFRASVKEQVKSIKIYHA